MTDLAGRFTEAAMFDALRQIGDRLDIPMNDAQLLRLTNNAVFALPAQRIVLRIARTHRLHDRVRKVALLATWFAAADAPTIRLIEGVDQPLSVGRLMATAWHYVPPTPPAPAAEELGHVLREFHALGTPPFPLPRWDPVADARSRLDGRAKQWTTTRTCPQPNGARSSVRRSWMASMPPAPSNSVRLAGRKHSWSEPL
jgi:hypothetical protein